MERFRRQGFTLAPEDEKPPEPGQGAELFVRAFFELSGARGVGMNGPLPIPVSEVREWLDLECIRDRGLRRAVSRVVRSMDRVLLHHFASAKPPPAGGKGA